MNRRVLIALIVVAILALAALSTLWWVPGLRQVPDLPASAAAPPPTATPDPPKAHRLHVSVRDAETGSPLPNARVQIGEHQGRTDEQGRYTTEVSHEPAPTIGVALGGYDPWQGTTDTSNETSPTIAVEVSLQPNTVTGQVVGEGLVPLPNAVLVFGGESVPLDKEARFVLHRVQTGDLVSAEHPGYYPARATFAGRPTLSLVLKPTSATVRVRDAMIEQAVPGINVCASDGSCQDTDGTGTAVLSHVVPGMSLSMEGGGYRTASVAYQGERTIEVELVPAELHGIVRDAESGQPLTNTILLVDDEMIRVDGKGRYHLADLSQVERLYVKSPGHRRITIPMDDATKASRYDALDPCLEPDRVPCVDINLPRFAVHGIYANFGLLNWDTTRLLRLIDLVDRSPLLNAIVLDVKSDYGYLAFESDDPIVAAAEAAISPRMPLDEFLRLCEERHIYTIARMVIFKDSPLIKARPELAVRHPNGAIFYDSEGMAWADPTRKEVWEYNIAATMEAIRLGFDEIQYDYLRYPSDSTSLAVVRALVYSLPSTLESRTEAIQGFVMAAKAAIDPTPAFFSADMFGYALSVIPEHDMRIGQRLMDLAPHVDYVCPMVYPSTFIPGNLGLASPSDEPYQVVAISMRYGLSRTNTLMRPWLQHYWYDRYQIAEQRRAAEEATDVGWCFWNARGEYDELFFIPPEGIEP